MTRILGLERRVLTLARASREARSLSPGRQPSGLARLLAIVFGSTRPQPLANPKLEALRRLGIDVMRSGAPSAATQAACLAAGWSLADIDDATRLAARTADT